jgi:hypothetical protein
MKTNEKLRALIIKARAGGKDCSTINMADALHREIDIYSQKEYNSFATQQGVIRAHMEISIMTLLDEINLMQREIELYKETINSIA